MKKNMEKIYKKSVAAFAAVVLTVTMAACGTKENKDVTTSVTTQTDASVATSSDAADKSEVTEIADAETTKEDATASEEKTESTTATENGKKTTEEKATEGKTESTTGQTIGTQSPSTTSAPSTTGQTTQGQSTTQAPSTTEKQTTTQAPSTTQAQTTTTEDTRTACEKNGHQWVQQYKTVHHDAEYKEVEYSVCACGWVGLNWDQHFAESNQVYKVDLNEGTGKDPWIVEANTCVYKRSRWGQEKVKDAYDEEVPNGYKCSVCGATKN